MRKFLLISLSGVLVGGAFALYMFSNIKETVATVVSEVNTVKAFQIGVFNVYDNALKLKETYSNSLVYQDGDKYRVFLAIYQDEEIINKMEKYYQNNNINIYLKEINTNEIFIEELKKYENLLKETNDLDTYNMANKNILELFEKTT